MNKLIKTTSIIVLVLFAGFLAVPLFSTTDCNMDCCTVPMNTACEMDMASDSCCETMSECSDVIYIPFVTAPIIKVNLEKELTVEYLTSVENSISFDELVSVPFYQLKILTSKAHAGFQTPLLI